MTLVHPSREDLIGYYYGWLPPHHATQVATHMEHCPFCALDTILAEDYFALLSDTLPAIPPVRATARDSVLGQLHRVVASLVTRPAIALAGPEDANDPTIYESGAIQIALRVVEMEGEKGIMGLVTGVEELPLEAHLRGADGTAGLVVAVDEAGQFYFAAVPTTAYDVVIVTPTLEIEVHVAAAPS